MPTAWVLAGCRPDMGRHTDLRQLIKLLIFTQCVEGIEGHGSGAVDGSKGGVEAHGSGGPEDVDGGDGAEDGDLGLLGYP